MRPDSSERCSCSVRSACSGADEPQMERLARRPLLERTRKRSVVRAHARQHAGPHISPAIVRHRTSSSVAARSCYSRCLWVTKSNDPSGMGRPCSGATSSHPAGDISDRQSQRLVRRLATDKTLPRGMRIRLAFATGLPGDAHRCDPRLHPCTWLRLRRDHRRRSPARHRPPRRTRCGRTHWPGTDDGFAALARLIGLALFVQCVENVEREQLYVRCIPSERIERGGRAVIRPACDRA